MLILLDLEEKAHPCCDNTNAQKTRRKPLGTRALAMRIDTTILVRMGLDLNQSMVYMDPRYSSVDLGH